MISRTEPLLAYHNNPELREQFVAEMRRHQQEDMIMQMATGEILDGKWRGCHVACAVHSMAIIRSQDIRMPYDHKLWPELLGMPVWMAHLCETVFEDLSEEDAKLFPVAFSKAVRCGKDLETIRMPLILFAMEAGHRAAEGDHKQALERILGLWRQLANGEEVAAEQWSEARAAARAACFRTKQSRITSTELAKDGSLMAAANLWYAEQMGDDNLDGLLVLETYPNSQYVAPATQAFADKLLELVAE